MTIREQIEIERDNWNRLKPATGIMQAFVLRNGRYYQGQQLPSNYKPRPIKQCFFNARSLAKDGRTKGKLRYCEGFARAKDFYFLFHHGWCINEVGNVIDTTLRNPSNYDYYGVWFAKHLIMGGTGWEALLASEVCYNVEFMKTFDPGLESSMEVDKLVSA